MRIGVGKTVNRVLLVLIVLVIIAIGVIASLPINYWLGIGLTYKQYQENIVYCNFSQLPQNFSATEQIKLPYDLERAHQRDQPKIKNQAQFEQDFWQEAEKLGISKEQLANGDLKFVIRKIADIVASRFIYQDVDLDPEFIKKYGKLLPIDTYFHLGLGDCDKYRDATLAAFSLVKKSNPKLINAYCFAQDLGGNSQPHAWVALLVITPDHLIVSHIDPTSYDNGSSLEADDYHIIIRDGIFLGRFYYELYDYRHAYEILKTALVQTHHTSDLDRLLTDMSMTLNLYALDYPSKALQEMNWLESRAVIYKARGEFTKYDHLLYYAARIAKKNNDQKRLEQYYRQLLRDYPNSYWTQLIINQGARN